MSVPKAPDRTEGATPRPSPWEFLDMPLVPTIWWRLLLVFGVFGAAARIGSPDPLRKAIALGWVAFVAGILGARRGLPSAVSAALVVGGCAVSSSALFVHFLDLWLRYPS